MGIKEQLYYLIGEYRKGNYTTQIFTDQFTIIYCNERSNAQLNKREEVLFESLNETTSRYSEFEDDIKKYPGVYTTEKDIKINVEKVYKDLKEYANGLL